MTAIEVSVKTNLKGLEDLTKNLDMGKLQSDMTYAGATIGSINARAGIERSRPEWPPLAAATIAAKGHSKILWKTGEMHDSIHPERRGRDAVYGSDKQYADNHEFGIGVPQREFLAPTTRGVEFDQLTTGVKAVITKAVEEANKK